VYALAHAQRKAISKLDKGDRIVKDEELLYLPVPDGIKETCKLQTEQNRPSEV